MLIRQLPCQTWGENTENNWAEETEDNYDVQMEIGMNICSFIQEDRRELDCRTVEAGIYINFINN